MNGYAAIANEWMASLAIRMADGDPAMVAEAKAYTARAAAIRAAAHAAFYVGGGNSDSVGTRCNLDGTGGSSSNGTSSDEEATAATMQCYKDTPTVDTSSAYTSATATSVAAFAGLPPSGAKGVLELVPFLKARHGRRGVGHGLEASGWMVGFMLEGLYKAAGEVDEGALPTELVSAGAEYAYSVLTNPGNNSWLGMLRQNATMTMESWTQVMLPHYVSAPLCIYTLHYTH
jgi:hypothetical protein